MPSILADYHMHTPLCGHATGQPEEYCRVALERGLEEIGFSDHAPLVKYPDPAVAMNFDQLPHYHDMIERARDAFKDCLKVKVGLEADYFEDCEVRTKEIVEAYDYDYVIGSVHFIDGWPFDHPDHTHGFDNADLKQVWRRYHELLRRSAESGLFQIMGHCDLVKKFGHKPGPWIHDEVERTAAIFQRCGVVIEINTAGLRKPVGEIYPSLDDLRIYAKAGVPLTFGSDAHRPEEVGADFDKAREWALAAGYREYVVFSKKRIERVCPLL